MRKRRIRRFERAAGKRLAWVYFSNNWWDGRIAFPDRHVERLARLGRVPFIRLMARSGHGRGADPNFSLASIAGGDWDSDLRHWCSDAAAATAELGTPLLAEFGTEVNGDWFPWNGRWNGGGETGDYGDPAQADGPERFRDAYRRIVSICRKEGAVGITWFFHVDVGGSPAADWNARYRNYYPGDAYVDWIGVSNYGKLVPGEASRGFARRLRRRYDELAALSPSKPIAVLEYGHAESRNAKRKARWIKRALRVLARARFPRIAAASYWHEEWRNETGSISNLHIDSSRRAKLAYRRGVHRKAFTSRPTFAPR